MALEGKAKLFRHDVIEILADIRVLFRLRVRLGGIGNPKSP